MAGRSPGDGRAWGAGGRFGGTLQTSLERSLWERPCHPSDRHHAVPRVTRVLCPEPTIRVPGPLSSADGDRRKGAGIASLSSPASSPRGVPMSTAAASSALPQEGGARIGLVLADLVPASRVR